MEKDPIRRVKYTPANPSTPPSTCFRPEGLEQNFDQFHFRADAVRNSALVTPGVAAGLELSIPAAGPGLEVRPGVAIDARGRMIALSPAGLATVLDPSTGVDRPVAVSSPIPLDPGASAGAALRVTIAFFEAPLVTADSHPAIAATAPCGSYEQRPRLSLEPPAAPGPDAVVLCTVAVDSAGRVTACTADGRQLAGVSAGALHLFAPADPAGQHELATLASANGSKDLRLATAGALELKAAAVRFQATVPQILRHRQYHGSIDLDAQTPGLVHLHFETPDHIPAAVKLFLRGDRFSLALYTQIGRHSHQAASDTVSLTHAHAHNIHVVGNEGAHSHAIRVGNTGGKSKPGDHHYNGAYEAGLSLGGWNGAWVSSLSVFTGGDNGDYSVQTTRHDHTIAGSVLGERQDHGHNITVQPFSAPVSATEGHNDFFSDLRVLIDGTDQTPAILARAGWTALGDGTLGHPFTSRGTGLLDVTALVPLTVGTHEIRFQTAAGGGKLHYDVICE
jgi:hypothetical protein